MSGNTTSTPGAPASSSAVRLSGTMVAQHLSGLLVPGKHATLAPGKRNVLLVRAEPFWDGPPVLTVGGDTEAGRRQAAVAVAPSPLAVYELVLTHLDLGRPVAADILVVLTDREEAELGDDLLSHAYRQRVHVVEPWSVVAQLFGVRLENVENKLRADEPWAAEALIDATPPGGWSRPGSRVLAREDALRQLAVRRLGLDAGAVNAGTLLRWSATPGGPERLARLRSAESEGLIAYLAERAGQAGEMLFALVEAGHAADAASFGLVGAALWVHCRDTADGEVFRARGRAERFLSEDWVKRHQHSGEEELDRFAAALGTAAEEYTEELIAAAGHRGGAEAVSARRTLETMLARAESLVRQFGAESAAAQSRILAAGLAARFAGFGTALHGGGVEEAAAALRELRRHRRAVEPEIRTRLNRAEMALRLTRWLQQSEPSRPHTETVAAALEAYLDEAAWVDLALEHIRTGGDPEPALSDVYDQLVLEVRARRREQDRAFAELLQRWTAAGTDPGAMLTVESFLERVVAPVVRANKPVLLVVLDGMSAAIAAELADELRERWSEFDPLTEEAALAVPPRRRAIAAALPTLTEVSRTSLFAGRLMRGDQGDERRLFSQHGFWGKQRFELFHKAHLRGEEGGDVFGAELEAAMNDRRTHVAVVINTIDDRLDKEQPSSDPSWAIREVGPLRTLLDLAASQGRVVIIASDHGHVVEHQGVRLDTDDALSNRHRAPVGALRPGEVELAGPRVVAPDTDGRIVALWESDAHYSTRRSGYHGGASLAEFTIPVVALLPFGATPPDGWRELDNPHPRWWTGQGGAPHGSAVVEVPVPLAQSAVSGSGPKQKPSPENAMPLFDLEQSEQPQSTTEVRPPAAETAPTGRDPLVSDLLASEIFGIQRKAMGRKLDLAKVEAALVALLDANGTLPVTALAQRAGVAVARADGFAAIMRQLLNFDSVQVLATLPDGRTLRLDTGMLRTQFGL